MKKLALNVFRCSPFSRLFSCSIASYTRRGDINRPFKDRVGYVRLVKDKKLLH